jgi:hypothetical protein
MISLLAVVVAIAALAVIVLGDRRQPATNAGKRGDATVENAPAGPAVPQEGRRSKAEYRAVAGMPYRRTRWYRRIGALFGIGITTVVVGALLAMAVAIAIVTAVLALRQAVG